MEGGCSGRIMLKPRERKDVVFFLQQEWELLLIKGWCFLLVKLPSYFWEARREALQLSLYYPPGYFKKTPRCSKLLHAHIRSTPSAALHLCMHINTKTAGENINHLTWKSHCTWHVPPIHVCSHITQGAAAVRISYTSFRGFLPCSKENKRSQPGRGAFAVVDVCKSRSFEPSCVSEAASAHCSVGGLNLLFNGHPDGSVDWTVMAASSKCWYHQLCTLQNLRVITGQGRGRGSSSKPYSIGNPLLHMCIISLRTNSAKVCC